jgi:hypothetical protein
VCFLFNLTRQSTRRAFVKTWANSMAAALFPPSRDITDDYRDVASTGGSSATGFHPLGESLLGSPRESIHSGSSLGLSGRMSSASNAGNASRNDAVDALVRFLDEDEPADEGQTLRRVDGKWDLGRVRELVQRSPADRGEGLYAFRASASQRRPFTSTPPPSSRRIHSPSIRLDPCPIPSQSRSVTAPIADRSLIWRDSPSPQPREDDVLSLSQAARLNASRLPSTEQAFTTASLRRRSTSSPVKRDRDLPPRSDTFPRHSSPLRDTASADQTLRPPSPRTLPILLPDQSQYLRIPTPDQSHSLRIPTPDTIALGSHGRSPSYESAFDQQQRAGKRQGDNWRSPPSPRSQLPSLPPGSVSRTPESSRRHLRVEAVAPPAPPDANQGTSGMSRGASPPRPTSRAPRNRGTRQEGPEQEEQLEMFNGRTIAEEAESVRDSTALLTTLDVNGRVATEGIGGV